MDENFTIAAITPGPAFPNTVKLYAQQGTRLATSIILHSDGRIEGDVEAVKGWLATADQMNSGVELIMMWLLLKELQRQDGYPATPSEKEAAA